MKLTKYHAAGNDFLIGKYEPGIDYSVLATKLCNRHLGVGADGLIIVTEKPWSLVIYNNDGTLANIYSNGMLCVAKYLSENNANHDWFSINFADKEIQVEITKKSPFSSRINLGKVEFSNEYTKVKSTVKPFFNQEILTVQGPIHIDTVYIGAVHTIVWVSTLEKALESELAKDICNNPIFVERPHVNFVKLIDDNNILVRTYDKVKGWILSCGTGAAAAYIVGKTKGKIDEKVRVHLEYGRLDFFMNADNIIMEGTATKIAEIKY
ncbi:MAG: diaminopimelate epimerase [Bacilli bacterium]|nr:diaminopimelate epimerase [Bacilli bacterium]